MHHLSRPTQTQYHLVAPVLGGHSELLLNDMIMFMNSLAKNNAPLSNSMTGVKLA